MVNQPQLSPVEHQYRCYQSWIYASAFEFHSRCFSDLFYQAAWYINVEANVSCSVSGFGWIIKKVNFSEAQLVDYFCPSWPSGCKMCIWFSSSVVEEHISQSNKFVSELFFLGGLSPQESGMVTMCNWTQLRWNFVLLGWKMPLCIFNATEPTQRHTYTHIHTNAHTHMYIHTHLCTQTHTHTGTHTKHTHLCT